jgi:hypothetical protein
MPTQLELHEKESRFGWPLNRRREHFAQCVKSGVSKHSHEIKFQGVTQAFPVIPVPIEMPKYRLSNGRTASLHQEYLARHPGAPANFFKTDPELLNVQEAQHEILLQVIDEEGLLKFFSDPANDQTEPVILDANGFVINGNRRLTAWRKLFYGEPGKYPHFSHIKAIMLPHCDERDLDKLEASLQIHEDIKADYSWDTQANMMLQKQDEHGMTLLEISEIYKMKLSEVEELIDMRNYAAEYLRGRGKENIWSLVSKSEFAFRKISEARKKMSDAPTGRKELFKQSAFVLIDSNEKEGRLYESIPEIFQYLDKVEEELQKSFKVQPIKEDKGIDELFGKQGKPDICGPLAREIQKTENATQARLIITEVIKAQNELKKEAKNAGYLLRKIADGNAALQAAINDGLKAESTLIGVDDQLAQLEEKVARIRKWLSDNA